MFLAHRSLSPSRTLALRCDRATVTHRKSITVDLKFRRLSIRLLINFCSILILRVANAETQHCFSLNRTFFLSPIMSKELTIQDFAKLRAPHVRMKDEAAVLRAINEIARGGANKLQVVTDFDRTMTKQHVNGSPVKSSFVIFEQSPMLPDSFKQESAKYFAKYRPIEIDSTLSMNQKERAMEEWMIITEEIMTGLTITKKEIRRLAKDYGSDIREHTKEMFEMLNREGVPVLVFSAGLGDIVEAILHEHDIYLDNTKIFSNFLKFDGDQIMGFKNKKLLHVFNKKEHAVEDDEYFKCLKGRTNALLMGDTTGDADMTEGVENIDTVLKIGFLYDNKETSLPMFMEKFDIVLIDDQTMDVPLEILKKALI